MARASRGCKDDDDSLGVLLVQPGPENGQRGGIFSLYFPETKNKIEWFFEEKNLISLKYSCSKNTFGLIFSC